MNKKLTVFLLVILAGVTGYFLGSRVHQGSLEAKLNEIRSLVRDNYVTVVDEKSLERASIDGILQTLDPHSEYFSPSEWQDYEVQLEGKIVGIGILISVDKDGALSVISPIEDTPAFRANLLPQDQIIGINGAQTKGMSLQEAIRRIRGQPGTTVTLKIQRKTESFEVTLKRETISLNPVKSKMLDEEIGYIRIAEFSRYINEDFDKAVDKLSKAGMKKLILDLRFNPGGLLDVCVKLTDKFLKEGVIVTTKSRKDSTTEIAKKGENLEEIPLIVLVNSGSASASEIFAAAIKDHKRGKILGETTYGKGTVQRPFKLRDGSFLKLTTAYYMTPSGQRLEKGKGIEPDVQVQLTEEEKLKVRDNIQSQTIDKQMQKAIDLLK